MKTTLTLIHPYSSTPEVILAPDKYCPNTNYYLVPGQSDFLKHGRMVAQAEDEMRAWMRRYENVFKGLKYWRERALASTRVDKND